jgi:fibronectin type 3 domain-containing protein
MIFLGARARILIELGGMGQKKENFMEEKMKRLVICFMFCMICVAGVNAQTKQKPKAKGGLRVSATAHSVSLSWGASIPSTGSTCPSGTGSTAITGYNVYRGTATGGEGSTPLVTAITVLTYTDTTVAAGSTYFYQVTGVNCVGESSKSNEVVAVIPNPLPPSAPTNLLITAVARNVTNGVTSVSVGWQDVPNTPVTYSFYSRGQVLTTGVLGNAAGTYTAQWSGALFKGSPIAFEVCDTNGICQSKLL